MPSSKRNPRLPRATPPLEDEFFPDDSRPGRRKSITSGISTLFRRQPSPPVEIHIDSTASSNLTPYVPPGPAYAAPSSVRPADPSGAVRPESRSGSARRAGFRSGNKNKKLRDHGQSEEERWRSRRMTLSNEVSASDTFSAETMMSGQSTEDTDGDDDDKRYYSNSESFDESNLSEDDVRGGKQRQKDIPARKKKKSLTSDAIRLPRRFRGFSTSISSLFLDESIVCGALACCGMILSSRTEFLLNERNMKRGLTRRGSKQGGARAPSWILGISLLFTIVLIMATFVIWGFTDNYEDYNNAANKNNGKGGKNSSRNDNNSNNSNGYYDDGKQNNDDAPKYDDGGQYGDDKNVANADDAKAGDDAVQADDGVVANDDAVQQQDDKNENNAVADDIYAMKDDAFNRNLHSKPQGKAKLESLPFPLRRHNFNGILKLRDYREYIIEPIFESASEAYYNLMTQFDADEYTALSKRPQNQYHQRQLKHPQRILESETTRGDIGSQVRMLIIAIFLFMLGVVGRRRRMRTRFSILRSRAQDDHLYYAALITNSSGSIASPDNTAMENFHEREDKYDGACSHTLFGCYPVDTQSANYADYGDSFDDDTLDDLTKRQRKGGDFMHRTMNTFFLCCCGFICKCWCQFFSICSLAQEARETRLLLPPKVQRIDLITHQPFHEYAKDVTNLRRKFMERSSRTWVQHYTALSRLSRYILLGFLLTVILVTSTLLLHPSGSFTWADAMVLFATFGQSFLVLMIVFGIFHRSDLSLDAVIKFFAVGFVICVPVGFIIEALLINVLVGMLYVVYYPIWWIAGEKLDIWIINNHHLLWVVGELVNAYLVAALVEELSKYYGFRFIEHPDLIFLTGLDRTAGEASRQGGPDSYKFDSQLVSEFSRSHDSDCNSVDSREKRRKSHQQLNSSLKNKDGEDEDEPELRSLQQQAAAITTGMISVAVGLACAENFMYVFFLGGTGGDMGAVSQEFAVLIFRSIFPVHALAAAMQSVHMIRKFIEEKHFKQPNVGVGKIIFPAVMLHGTFDAILMSINSYIELSWDNFYQENDDYEDGFLPYNPIVVNAIAWVGIIGVMIFSFGLYSYQNQVQNIRLMTIEQKYLPRTKQRSFKSPEFEYT